MALGANLKHELQENFCKKSPIAWKSLLLDELIWIKTFPYNYFLVKSVAMEDQMVQKLTKDRMEESCKFIVTAEKAMEMACKHLSVLVGVVPQWRKCWELTNEIKGFRRAMEIAKDSPNIPLSGPASFQEIREMIEKRNKDEKAP